MRLKQSRKGKKDMQNTDLEKLIKVDDKKETITIEYPNNPIVFHSILTSLVIANLDTIKDTFGQALVDATAYATLKIIIDQYPEAYEDLQKLEVQNNQIN